MHKVKMINTVNRSKMKNVTTCNDFEGYTAEFWDLQITSVGLIGSWHKEDEIKNYIKIEDKDPSIYIVVSFLTNLITKHDLNTNLNISHKELFLF